uniref:Uncharacterized protein n=1 Tax=Candidatus Kentrum sp. DK TaxID=2126562 RepID=A0A450SK56_9GAMM|nr:MAG: hypothetical protein BECKDK2373C_GA0170839_104112 [Candidatus Kentron sp. DK]
MPGASQKDAHGHSHDSDKNNDKTDDEDFHADGVYPLADRRSKPNRTAMDVLVAGDTSGYCTQ